MDNAPLTPLARYRRAALDQKKATLYQECAKAQRQAVVVERNEGFLKQELEDCTLALRSLKNISDYIRAQSNLTHFMRGNLLSRAANDIQTTKERFNRATAKLKIASDTLGKLGRLEERNRRALSRLESSTSTNTR